MYRTGHYGVALLTYAPVAAVTSMLGYDIAAVIGAIAVLALSMIPDYDRQVPLLEHRGLTHSLVFAVLVGLSLASVTTLLIDPSSSTERLSSVGFAFLVGLVAIVSHLLADMLTPTGVKPFWPLSDRRFAVGLVRSGDPIGNYVLLVCGLAVLLTGFGGPSSLVDTIAPVCGN